MKKIVIATFALFFIGKVWAYPNFIGFSYQSCLTCHYNPFGNGPLNDYGRALGAGVVADRLIWAKNKSEDQVASQSGFMFSTPKQQWFRPSFDYRGINIVRDFDGPNQASDFIHMQADLNVVIKNPSNKWYASASVGYAPTPRGQLTNNEPNYRSREHYLAYRMNESSGLYIGLMDKVFGIRISDHSAFSRSVTKLAQNDQTHGIVFHYTKPQVEFGVHYFLGNLDQEASLRQVGLSGQLEYTLNPKARLGFSVLSSKSDVVKDLAWSFHFRKGLSKGSSLIFESGQMVRTSVATSSSTTSHYGLLQGHILARRGLFIFNKMEYLRSNTSVDDYVVRVGPGFQFFPFQGLEFRSDLYNSRVYSAKTSSRDQWTLTGQVHLWL